MRNGSFAEAVATVGIAALLLLLGAGLLDLSDGLSTPAESFFDAGPRLAVTACGVGFALWALIEFVAHPLVKSPGKRTKLVTGIAGGFAAAVVNGVLWTIFGITAGGWGMLLVGIGIAGSIGLILATTIATLVATLVVFRSTRQ